jgi:NOL1/NOP2/sun family putative RNA methylase
MFSEFLLSRYREIFSEEEIEALKEPIAPSIRVNTLKISEEALVRRLEERGFELEKIRWVRHGYFVRKAPFSLGSTPEYLMGYYFLQDPSSMYACEVLDPKAGEVVLDMAAAPGGKTTHLAELMNNSGTVVSIELNRERMKSLRSNITRMGVENVITIRMNALDAADLGISFDRILLDAPCTGTGTLFKNPEVAKKEKEDVERCTALQRSLLEVAGRILKKGGGMVYCTCSLLPEENELMLRHALKMGLKLESVPYGERAFTEVYGEKLGKEMGKAKRFYPYIHKTQGFFISRLSR